jgi:molybdate transport system substrate-binding protein
MLRSSLLVIAWVFYLSTASAAEVKVAVAANFAAPLQQIAAAFARDTGHSATIMSGATGALYAQIANGAPDDVFLSADAATPDRLASEGLAVPSSRFTYALGKLVLWSAQPGFVDAAGFVLRQGRFNHLAIANPKVAPYGAAAVETLAALGLSAALAPKLLTGESIAQAAQFVLAGASEALHAHSPGRRPPAARRGEPRGKSPVRVSEVGRGPKDHLGLRVCARMSARFCP